MQCQSKINWGKLRRELGNGQSSDWYNLDNWELRTMTTGLTMTTGETWEQWMISSCIYREWKVYLS
jgi:hypothetical protein